MKKWICLLVCLSLLAVPVRAAEPEAPSAILIERSTGQVLYEKNADERLRPASVTKIMTLLLIMEALDDGRIGWDDMVTASAAAAAKGGSQIYLEENEQLPLREMLKSIVVSSANDCACAMAEHIAGSEAAFVEMMNKRAQELGMTDTTFVNCTGLDDEPEAAQHLTTARDIAVMSRALLQHPQIREYTTIWMDTVRDGQFGLSNTNKLVRFYDGATGLKTGYTSAAGYCLSASAERGGMELIAVVLHCDSSQGRFDAAKALLNQGFANYALVEPQPQEPIPQIPVKLGREDFVQAVPADSAPILVQKADAARAEVSFTLAEGVTAPVEAGQELGTLTVRAGEKVLAQIPLQAACAVEALTWFDILRQMLRAVLMAA